MLKRAHDTPRLILNDMSAYTTDTAYRITTRKGISAKKLVFCFLNALTALSAELEGRHYGGGVLELVPSEIEKLLIPVPTELQSRVSDLDKLVREQPTRVMLEQQSREVLGELDVDRNKQETLLAAWMRLKNRRQRISDSTEGAQNAA